MFRYSENYYGGTEYMAENINKYIESNSTKYLEYICMVWPSIHYKDDFNEILKTNKEAIIWIHTTLNQLDYHFTEILFYLNKINKIKYIIVPSNWSKNRLLNDINFIIDEKKIIVIPNAVDKIDFDKNKFNSFEKIELIYTSASYRGLQILLYAMKYIDNKNIVLRVFGDFNPNISNNFINIYYDDTDERILFYSSTPKKTVDYYYSKAHIFCYPSIFEETFCISQAQAMSAGCLCITTDLAALKEISKNFSISIESVGYSEHDLAYRYSKILSAGIEKIYLGLWNPEDQCNYIDENFSWPRIKKYWENLNSKL